MPDAPVHPISIDVVFARNLDLARPHIASPALVIVPSHDTWNDHGRRLFANLFVFSKGDARKIPIGLMFEGYIDTDAFLTDLFEDRGPVVPASQVGSGFVSLQREASTYALLVELLGFDAAVHGLRQVHDAVLAKLEGKDATTLALVDSLDFHVGMMRSSGYYVAMRRGGQYLRRVPIAAVEDAAISFEVRTVLPFSDEDLVVDFDFALDPLFRDRCCVLIGENGVGKTHLLNAIVDNQLRRFDHFGNLAALPGMILFRRILVYSSAESDRYPGSIPPWAGLDYEYHPLITGNDPLGSIFVDAVVDCLRNDSQVFGDGSLFGRMDLLEALLRGLGFYEKLYRPLKPDYVREFSGVVDLGGKPYLQFERALGDYREAILFQAIDRSRQAAVLVDRLRERQLSSGELVMLNFVAQVVSSIENGSLLLFDEPETHLHPKFVSQFMDALQEMLERTRSVAIVATHSAHIVREVPRQRVNILRVREVDGRFRHIEVQRPQMQTFGSNVDDISRFVFGDGLISHRYERILAEWAAGPGREMGIDRIIDDYGPILNSETLSFVARTIRNAQV